MSSELVADSLEDLEVDGDREVFVDGTGDLSTTSGVETVKQSVMLNASEVLRPLVGQPVSGQMLESVASRLERVLERDPQIASVSRVDIVEIDEQNHSVTIEVFVENNNSFEIGVDVQS